MRAGCWTKHSKLLKRWNVKNAFREPLNKHAKRPKLSNKLRRKKALNIHTRVLSCFGGLFVSMAFADHNSLICFYRLPLNRMHFKQLNQFSVVAHEIGNACVYSNKRVYSCINFYMAWRSCFCCNCSRCFNRFSMVAPIVLLFLHGFANVS